MEKEKKKKIKINKFYSWKFKDSELIKNPVTIHFNSLPFEELERKLSFMSNVAEYGGILTMGDEYKREILQKLIGSFINLGIFLRDNELIDINRNKPEEVEKDKERGYLG